MLWYKNAIVYELDVKTFQDSDGNGFGDFQGLIQRLPYIAGLGVTCIWLRPFYPSPLRDDGYDITDYFAVDPRVGSLGDFVEFLTAANDAGLRVLIDLVVNHTSLDHPWFQEARSNASSPLRDYYVWSKQRPQELAAHLSYPGAQTSNWTFDDRAQAWYYHRFFSHQPDLNTENPAVRQEICRIIGFWTQLGVSGFRVDAVPFLLEATEGDEQTKVVSVSKQDRRQRERTFDLLQEMRQALAVHRGDAIFLAEANVPLDRVDAFFGPNDDRVQMVFDFDLNANLYLALAREQAGPIEREIRRATTIPPAGQWANFLRNHDGLDLQRLAPDEREEVLSRFAPENTMRIYGRAIRRRLAPILGGDSRRIELAYAILLSLPGSPVMRHGEEIGMGENLSLDGRLAVRTPMQWSNETNGGFSAAPVAQLVRPVMTDGPFGVNRINVRSQQGDSKSVLFRLQQLIHIRRQCPEFGNGTVRMVDTEHPAVLGLQAEWNDQAVVTYHNLSSKEAAFDTGFPAETELRTIDLLPQFHDAPPIKQQSSLPGYCYRWLRLNGGRWRAH